MLKRRRQPEHRGRRKDAEEAGPSDSEPEEHQNKRTTERGPRLQRDVEPDDGSGSDMGGSSDVSDSESDGEASDLEDVPFEKLQQLRQDGSTSAAAMKARAAAVRKSGGAQQFKREGKHRPVEAPSKKPVPVFREVFQTGKRESRDPRFESLSAGQYKEERFKKQYAFLYDEQLPAERGELKAALAKTKNPSRKEDLKEQLVKVEAAIRNEESRRKRASFQEELKAKERAAVAGGKRPYYLNKGEARKAELVAQYRELKASGGLDKFLAKRRRRNAAKDHRYLPSSRRGGAAGGGDGGDE